ncbi:MAG: PASTA domain-containing protein [Candidatus Azobacteroides sp.]|nr:PASTA domain-containing protein [Candidatus Azobacteroides sp.]
MKILNLFINIYVKNLLLACLILFVLVYLVLGWLDTYTKHGRQVIVPPVEGLQVAEAAPFFKQRSLRYAVIDSIFIRNRPFGSILETIPPVGTNVKEGRTIYLTVNASGAPLLIVPGVKDVSQRQAYAMLRSLGFESITVQKIRGAYKDLVVGLETSGKQLNAGDRLPADAPLTLVVSSGDDKTWENDVIDTLSQPNEPVEYSW